MCGIWGILSSNVIKYDQNLLFNNFNKLKPRGPDRSVYISNANYIVGFHRLAIMDTSSQGDQPFSISYYYINNKNQQILRTVYVIVNGEIYNWEKIKFEHDIQEFCNKINYQYKSNSDCEIILPMFLKYINENSYSKNPDIFKTGLKELLIRLDGEFAFGIYDCFHNIVTGIKYYNLWLGRDRFGIRPLFYSKLDCYTIGFGSELKSLINLNTDNVPIEQIDPRSWCYWGGQEGDKLFQSKQFYYSVGSSSIVINPYPDDVYRMCRTLLTKSVVDRLQADREIGCLLSGGLDSSLIAAIASAKLKEKGKILRTYSVGMDDSPDVKYAKIVANHIGSTHTNFNIPQDEWTNAIKDVIKIAETFDITTVRATTGQYLICKKIAETTDIKVLLIGDGSDEATGGYLYFHKTPNPMALHFETQRLLHWIHYFDVLRADRGVASNGLEARVPYLSHEFIDFYFKVDPVLRIPKPHTLSNGQTNVYEKYLLRKSFDNGILPECVLWRKKEAFSDGISSESKSWYEIIQEMTNKLISDDQFEHLSKFYHQNCLNVNDNNNNDNIIQNVPHTKEALYYRMIFDEFYPGQSHVIPYYWMPKWIDNVSDPSARTLKIYKDVEKEVKNVSINSSKSNYGGVSIPF